MVRLCRRGRCCPEEQCSPLLRLRDVDQRRSFYYRLYSRRRFAIAGFELPFLDLWVLDRHTLYLRCLRLVVRKDCGFVESRTRRRNEAHIGVVEDKLHVVVDMVTGLCRKVPEVQHIVLGLQFENW